MEKQTKRPPLQWLLGLLLCCVAFGAQAQTVKIEGYTSDGMYNGYPLFKIDSPQITVSSTSGSFNHVYIDDNQVALNNSSYLSSYSVDISSYLDGGYHKLQLKRVSSNYGICYFTSSVEPVSIDGLNYGLIDKIATVIGAGIDVEEANIPATISKDGVDYSVKTIGESAFANRIKLHKVTIPESVTRIGNSAFANCSSLTSITIPETVTSIGNSAFSGCKALTTLNFNAITCTSCGSLSYPAFPSTIANLTIGEKVTNIPSYFLYNGSQIENLTIPNSVTTIGMRAFYDTKSLISLTLGAAIREVGDEAFSYKFGDKYENISIPKVFWLGNTPPQGKGEISGLVNYVANYQYSLNNQVKYQFLSSKFTVDGTVYVPVSPSERTCDVVDCIYDESIAELKITENVVNKGIKMTVNNIQQYAFYDNNYITKAELSNKGYIGDKAFLGCSSLRTATISNGGDIGDAAFSSCSSLESATISNAGNIGDRAFLSCSSLESATISNAGNIGVWAFSSCSGLESATISNKGNIDAKAFLGCANLVTALIANEGNVGYQAFYELTKLSQVTLGDKVTGLGTEAFYGCSALPEIVIPNSVASLGTSVFQGCASLASATIGTQVPNLPARTFSGCAALEQIVIPQNVALIRDYVFYGCSKLSDVTIEDGNGANDILTLGSNGSEPLFNGCPLDEVYIGRKLSYETGSSYGYSPFYRNTSLRTVEITDAETEIYDNEFYGCSNLKSLQIGNGVKRIGNRAFSGCSALDYFSAGCNVETIGNEAFSDCTGLTKFYSYSKLPPVCGDQALDDINKWECTLYVPEQSSDEYRAAPQWKDFFFIEESADAGVGSVLVGNDSEMEVYDLQGRMVGTSLEGLKAGIYIVKQGGTTSKVAVN